MAILYSGIGSSYEKKTALGKKEPHVKYVGFKVKCSRIAYLRRRTMILASASMPAISAYELGSGTAVRVMLSIIK